MAEKPTITIDGREHELEALSDLARQQLANLQVVDAQIQHLQQQLIIAQTARSVYANILQTELPKADDQKTDTE